MSFRVTLKQVAAEAGVSHMTVSRVVRGEKRVKPATADRVKVAIKKLGFRPDPMLSALAAYRLKRPPRSRDAVVAWLAGKRDAYHEAVLAGAVSEAERFGYSIALFPVPQEPVAIKRLSRMIRHRGVHGVLIGPTDSPLDFSGWPWEQFSAVSLGVLDHHPTLHAVGMDYFHGLITAHKGLHHAGCRRIGLMLRPFLEARTGHRWLGAYRTCSPGFPICWIEPDMNKITLARWIRKHRLDGVLSIEGAWHETLRNIGVRVAYLNPHHAIVAPAPAHIALDVAAIGREGVRLLHHLLLRDESGLPETPVTVLLKGRWYPEETG